MALSPQDLIVPRWAAPERVRALTTTRGGGGSRAPFDGLNLGDHVDDDPVAVAENRRILQAHIGTEVRCQWLQQVHGVEVVPAVGETLVEADASVSDQTNRACLVMTADCLPVLFCSLEGDRVAAAHAGWRGLAGGVLEQTLRAMRTPSDRILCWLGPAIGPAHFEVGEEVRAAFVAQGAEAEAAFKAQSGSTGKWLADLYALARLRLERAGVAGVYGGGLCTFDDSERFFSYRREGRTGRMASLIWLAE